MHWRLPLALATLALAATAAASAAVSTPLLLPTAKPDFVVNTFTQGSQNSPAVAVDGGGFVVAWVDDGELPDRIKARRFDAAGTPRGPEIEVELREIEPPGSPLISPRIASAADGRFVVVWTDTSSVFLRRFDSQGQPVADSEPVDVPTSPNTGPKGQPDVAMAPDGSFVVVWTLNGAPLQYVFAQRYGATGQRVGGPIQVSLDGPDIPAAPRVAMAGDGGFLAVWESSGSILARRFGADGSAAAPISVGLPHGSHQSPAVVLLADGTATVVWTSPEGPRGRRLDATGSPATPEMLLDPTDAVPFDPPALAADSIGNVLALWEDVSSGQLRGRLFDRGLSPLAEEFTVGDVFFAVQPALVATPFGGFVAVWRSGFESKFPGVPPPSVPGLDGDGEGVAAKIFGAAACTSNPGVLCLGPGGEFRASVAWTNPNTGETGIGHPLPLTGDTGAFWFFGDQNLELMVKVLDGGAVNGNFWVYGGSLSNVEYTLTVTDFFTGRSGVYHNPAGQFASFADVDAFPRLILDPPPPSSPPGHLPAPVPGAGCPPVVGPQSPLCLGSGQFTATVQFTDPRTGLAGAATAVPLTADTGAFWFFDDSNLELTVKVLDGRAVNGKFWVFYGALSDVDYTLTVTDTETGQQKIYHNPRGTLASRADLAAF